MDETKYAPNAGFNEDAPQHQSNFKPFPQSPKDGEQEHRILPGIHTQGGMYHKGWAIHYGAMKKVGDKTIPMPFICVEEVEWVAGEKTITRPCAACNDNKAKKQWVDAQTAKMTEAGASKEEIAEKLKKQLEWVRNHNRSFGEYVNVKDSSGKYFTARYPSKEVWKKVQEFVQKYAKLAKPIDAVKASQGLWFRITRSGKGQYNTEYKVEVVMEDVVKDGETFQRPKLAPLTPDDAAKAKAGCYDLNDLGFKVLTPDQVTELVQSKYDDSVIKRLWASSANNHTTASEPAPEAQEATKAPAAATQPPAPKVEAPAPAPKAPAPSPEVEAAKAQARIAALQAEMSALVAKTAQATTPEVKSAPTVVVPPAATEPADSGEADFLQGLNDSFDSAS